MVFHFLTQISNLLNSFECSNLCLRHAAMDAEVSSLEGQISGIKSTLDQLQQQGEITEDMQHLKSDLLELLELSEHRLLELKKKALLDAVKSMEAESESCQLLSLSLSLRLTRFHKSSQG